MILTFLLTPKCSWKFSAYLVAGKGSGGFRKFICDREAQDQIIYEHLANGRLKYFHLPGIFTICAQGYKTLDTFVILYFWRQERIYRYDGLVKKQQQTPIDSDLLKQNQDTLMIITADTKT